MDAVAVWLLQAAGGRQAVLREVERITGRTYSPLLDVDEETWAEKVQPVIDRLLALPEPGAPRKRASRSCILVFEKP